MTAMTEMGCKAEITSAVGPNETSEANAAPNVDQQPVPVQLWRIVPAALCNRHSS
jgi:hypothetical protein